MSDTTSSPSSGLHSHSESLLLDIIELDIVLLVLFGLCILIVLAIVVTYAIPQWFPNHFPNLSRATSMRSVKWGCVIWALVATVDFYSDLFLAILLSTFPHVHYYVPSLVVIIVSYGISVIYTTRIKFGTPTRNKQLYYQQLNSWLENWHTLLLTLTLVTGCWSVAVEVCNSGVFSLDGFSMPLSESDLKDSRKNRLFFALFLRNIPMFVIQIAFLMSHMHHAPKSIIFIVSLVFTVVSSVLSIYYSHIVPQLISMAILKSKGLSAAPPNKEDAQPWTEKFRMELHSVSISDRLLTSHATMAAAVTRGLSFPSSCEWVKIVSIGLTADKQSCVVRGRITIPKNLIVMKPVLHCSDSGTEHTKTNTDPNGLKMDMQHTSMSPRNKSAEFTTAEILNPIRWRQHVCTEISKALGLRDCRLIFECRGGKSADNKGGITSALAGNMQGYIEMDEGTASLQPTPEPPMHTSGSCQHLSAVAEHEHGGGHHRTATLSVTHSVYPIGSEAPRTDTPSHTHSEIHYDPNHEDRVP